MSMAKNLRLLRRIRGLTLEDLSEKAGISVSYLSRIESGNRRITDAILIKLAALLRCDPEEIVSNEVPETQIEKLGFKSLNLNENKPTKSELMHMLESVSTKLQGSVSRTKNFPVFSAVYTKNAPENTSRPSDDSIPLKNPSDWVETPPELEGVKGAFSYYVTNSEMMPRYQASELVYVHPQRPLTPNSFALIILPNDKVLLRQFKRAEGEALFFSNLELPDIEEVYNADDIKGLYRIIGSRESA